MTTQAIGQLPHRVAIDSISLSYPCIVTTTEEHGFSTFSFVRLTNMNGMMPSPQHGMDQLNNNRYRIVVLSSTSFKIQNPITYQDIDSTNFTPYTTGGSANLVEDNFYFYGETGEDDGES